ncbi:kinesin-like protein KIF20B [Ornithodoros turicata]|uniref:kinesin-like protein KIF20B n=1 Tax=Ornithodoros turicata TaxID=34597 RepID=UPI003138DBC4
MDQDNYDQSSEDECRVSLSEPDVKRKLTYSYPESSALLVYLRLRPVTSDTPSTVGSCLQMLDSTTVLAAPSSADSSNQKKFTFSEVFGPSSTQEQVFETAALGLIDNLINGKNVLMFAYGPTSSGKTYTMQGTFTHPGIIPRTLERLFKTIGSRTTENPCLKPEYFGSVVRLGKKEVCQVLKKKSQLLAHHKEKEMESFSTFVLSETSQASDSDALSVSTQNGEVFYAVWLSFYEVYNENVYDLLDMKKIQKRPCLKLGQDSQKQTYVKGLCEVPVASAEEAYALLCVAKSNLHTAETFLNRSSSRSHSCFNVRLVQYSGEVGDEDCVLSTLTLCDLAGSERSTKAGTSGGTLREAGRINNSLMVLSRCLESLRQNSSAEKLVPFRDSKLTQIMQPFFGNAGIVAMVVNVNPDLGMAHESFQALKLSAVACEVLPSLSKSGLTLHANYSRLSELWQKSSRHWSSIGVGHGDAAAMESSEDEFGSEEVEELFETIRVLTEEREKAEKEAARRKETCVAYEKYIENLKNHFRELETLQQKSMERQLHFARERAKLDVYAEAEAESNLDLLRQIDEANEMIDNLETQLEEAMEHRESKDIEAVRAEYDEKVASMASTLALKEKLLGDACSEVERLKMQLEIRETEERPTDPAVEDEEDLRKSLRERDDTIETLRKQFENFRKESARKQELLEQEATAAQLLHEKDIWVMRTQLKVKEEAASSLAEELNKERRLREELQQAAQVQKVCGLELLPSGAASSVATVEVQGDGERQAGEDDPSGSDTAACKQDSRENVCCIKCAEMKLAKDASDQALRDRNTEIGMLTTKLQLTTEELSKLQDNVKFQSSVTDELEALHQRYESLLKDVSMKDNAIEKLELEKCGEYQKRTALESSLDSATKEFNSLRVELEQQRQHQQKIEAELERTVQELKVLQTKYDNLETQQKKAAEIQLAADELRNEQRTLQEHLARKDAEIKELRTAVERESDQARILRDEITGATSSRDQIKLQLDKVKTDYDDLMVQQTNLTASLDVEQKERTALEAALNGAKEELQKAHAEIKQQCAQHAEELEKARAEYEALAAEQRKAELAAVAVAGQLQAARDSSKAENEARMAAEERVREREEEINRLRELISSEEKNKLLQSSSLSSNEQENDDVESSVASRRRRTPRQIRVSSTDSNEAQFKLPRRRTRATGAASAHKECAEVTPERNPALTEQSTASLSPLKRLRDFIVGMRPSSPTSAQLQCERQSAAAKDKSLMAAEVKAPQKEDVNNLRDTSEEKGSKILQVSSSSLNVTDQENSELETSAPTRRRRTQRQASVRSAEDSRADLKTPRRRTRAMVAASAHKECPMVTPDGESALDEQNAVCILPGGDGKEQKSPAKKRKGHRTLLPSDVDNVFNADAKDGKSEERKLARTRSKRN